MKQQNLYADELPCIPPVAASAEQWYERDPVMQQVEIAAMRHVYGDPHLEPGYLADGRMYWDVTIHPNLGPHFSTRTYRIWIIYDADHPHQGFGTSARVMMIDPSLKQLSQVVEQLPYLEDKTIPHMIPGPDDEMYVCTIPWNCTRTNMTAATSYLLAVKHFEKLEVALRSNEYWEKFHIEKYI